MINKHRQAERHKHFRQMLERATLSEIKEMIKKINLKICDMKQTLNLTIQRKGGNGFGANTSNPSSGSSSTAQERQ